MHEHTVDTGKKSEIFVGCAAVNSNQEEMIYVMPSWLDSKVDLHHVLSS